MKDCVAVMYNVYLVPVNVMNPLVGRLPDDSADPQSQVSRHQVHETETGKQAKPEKKFM